MRFDNQPWLSRAVREPATREVGGSTHHNEASAERLRQRGYELRDVTTIADGERWYIVVREPNAR